MKTACRVALTIVFLTVLGCRNFSASSPAQEAERFGITDSPGDHPIVGRAVATTSTVLGTQSTVRISAGWTENNSKASFNVYAAMPTGFGQNEIMASYEECACIVVQKAALSGWLKTHLGTNDVLLGMDTQNLLAYMLLHEAGHISEWNKTQTASRKDSASQVSQKAMEIAADEFAGNAIARALDAKGSERGVAAAKLAMTLSQLSWNLSAHRLLDNFGGTILNKPSLFGDSGLSHPNLEWRILSVNAAITKSEAARQILDDFERRRNGDTGYHLFPR